jgi:hypothetical protein
MGQGLLCDAELIGQRRLRQAALFAGRRDARAQLLEGSCLVNLPGSQMPFPHPDVHAAAVAAAHV